MTTSIIEEPEYMSSATLIVLGTRLQPREVSTLLRMRPSQAWARGDAKRHRGTRVGDSVHEWGGWKKVLPPSQRDRPLPQQLLHWLRLLKHKADAFSSLRDLDCRCVLNCYVGTSATATITLSAELQMAMSELGLDLELDVFVTP
jgi:hypothetical protein